MLKGLLELGEEEPGLISRVENFVLNMNEVRVMDPHNPQNEVLTNERQFESMCSTLEDNGVNNPKALTEFEWWNKVLYLKKKSEALERAYNG